MEIYLVRHTTPDIEKGICYGQADIGVGEGFEKEKATILEKLPFKTMNTTTKIYSSPLQRCKLLATSFGQPVLYDERLKELDFGNWELQPWNAIAKVDIDPWMEDFVNVRVTNGESYIDLEKRVLAFFEEVVTQKQDKLIIVTHAGVIRALLANITNTALKDSFSISLSYGHVVKIEKTDQSFKIVEGLVTL